MKKLLFIAICLASTIAMAEETAYVKMTLTANTSKATYSVRISEDTETSNYFKDGEDAELQTLIPANNSSVFVYAIVPTTEGGTKNCNSVYNNDVLGLPLGFKTNKTETDYTISFSGVMGNLLYLHDALLNTITPITNDTTYKFTADAGQKVVDDRFFIYKPGELKICHQNGSLVIDDNPYTTTNIVVKNAAGEEVINVAPNAIHQEILLDTLPAGRYTVEFNGGEKTYIIAVKPELTETPVP